LGAFALTETEPTYFRSMHGFYALVAYAITHHARVSLALNIPRLVHPEFEYAFFAHHKTGTALASQLESMMAETLNITHEEVGWNQVRDDDPPVGCIPNAVTLYVDMRAPTLKRIIHQCPSIRAVHMIRRPSSIVKSDYVFCKHFGESPQYDENAEYHLAEAQRLKNMSFAEGIKSKCKDFHDAYAPQYLACHQLIQDKGLTNVIEVSLEDFEQSYDNTTRSIFEHFLGSGHPSIDTLVTKARRFDLNRMSYAKVDDTAHVSDDSEEHQVFLEMQTQLEMGDPCMLKLMQDDERMGYSQVLG